MFAPKCFLTQQCLHLSAFSHNNVCTQVQPRSDAYNTITSLQVDTYLYLCIYTHITFVNDYEISKQRITNDPLLDQIITMDSHISKMPLCLLLRKTVAEAKQLWSTFGSDNYNNITSLQRTHNFTNPYILQWLISTYLIELNLLHMMHFWDQILKMTTNAFFTMPLQVCLLLSKTNTFHKQCN